MGSISVKLPLLKSPRHLGSRLRAGLPGGRPSCTACLPTAPRGAAVSVMAMCIVLHRSDRVRQKTKKEDIPFQCSQGRSSPARQEGAEQPSEMKADCRPQSREAAPCAQKAGGRTFPATGWACVVGPDIQAEAHPPFSFSGGSQSPASSLLGRKHSEQVRGQPVSEVKGHHSGA